MQHQTSTVAIMAPIEKDTTNLVSLYASFDIGNMTFKTPNIPIWRKKKVIIGKNKIEEHKQAKYKKMFLKHGFPLRILSKNMVSYAIWEFVRIQKNKKKANGTSRQRVRVCLLCNWPRTRDFINGKNNIFCNKCAFKVGIVKPRKKKLSPKKMN